MFAVIETGGKQYIVESGAKLKIEKLPVDEGGVVTFDKVLLIADDGKVTVGKPYIAGMTVEADVTRQGRARKIQMMRYHSKTRRRRRKGHRQPFTEVAIKTIKK
ncbi:MAG: 50S ribosomal protein L21 [Patescibacteria group bacterium]